MGGNQDKKLTLIVDLVNKTEKKFKDVYNNLEEVERKTENTRRAMREMGAVGAVAFAGLAVATKRFLSDAAELEQAEIAFETMLGSGEKAKKMLEELSDFAAKTPFELQGIRATAKQLLAMSIPAEDMIPTMKALGDVSAGLGVDLDRLAYNYGQVKTQTKLTGVELKDFMRAGVPLIGTLADMLGKSEAEIQEMVSAGEIGFPIVEEAFRRMTSEGGQFQDLMFKQSQSLSGQLSNLQDNLTRMSEIIGTALLPVAKQVTDQLIKITEKISAWAAENPILAATILKVALAATALMALMGVLGLALPRIVLGFNAAGGAALWFGKTLITLGTKMAHVITMSALMIKAIFKKQTYIMAADKVTKAYAATTLFLSNAFKTATAGATLFIRGLGLLKLALISTGIGALIVLVGYLAAKFIDLSNTVGGVGNAIKLFWAEFKVNTLSAIETFLGGIAKVLNALPGVDDALGDSIETIGWLKDAAEEDSKAVADAIATQGMAATAAAAEIGISAEDVDGSMADILASVGDTSEGAEDYMKKLADTVGSIRDEIRETYDDMAAATRDFQKSIGQETANFENDVVDEVAKAYEKKKELERDLKRLRREDDPSQDEINRLQEQIDEQSDILETYKDMQLDLDNEIAERRKYLRMNELEQMQADHEKRLQMLQKEYLEDQVKMLQKLLALKQEEKFVIQSLDVQKQAALEAELAKQQSHRETLASQKAGLSTWIGETTSMYNDYVKDINDALSNIEGSGRVKISFSSKGSLAGRASGGPVQPGRPFMVGEKGPELFTPGQHGIISPSGRSGGQVVNVYFTGNTFTGERYADEIKRKIVRDLQQTMKLSVT